MTHGTTFILGLNSAYHESSACLLADRHIIALAEEERFTRVKHAKRSEIENSDELPLMAIRFCLEKAGIGPGDISHVGYSLNPKRRLRNIGLDTRVLEGDWGSETGEQRFFEACMRIPGRMHDLGFRGKWHWLDHHRCHAASAYFPSPYTEAAVLTVDGIGETSSGTLSRGEGSNLEYLDEIAYPASLGFLWEKISRFLGFDEYDASKVMGLAAYGDRRRFRDEFNRLIWLLPDGRYSVDHDSLCFRVDDDTPLEELFGVRKRIADDLFRSASKDIAAALQDVTERVLLHLVHHAHTKTNSQNLCLAGGVALNCVANRAIQEKGPFANNFVQPVAHDAGTALGAAMVLWHDVVGGAERSPWTGVYLGPSYTDEEGRESLRAAGLAWTESQDIATDTATLLANGRVVGWFQGALEAGPRALGNRSLLADPRRSDMRDLLNKRIKEREDFRPFGGSILEGEANSWFDINDSSSAPEYMLVACPTRESRKDSIPSIVHVDGTCRIQIVRRETNPRFHELIECFYRLTGVPILLNTSFNCREPIVCSPTDAINTFMTTKTDALVIGNLMVVRQ